MVSAQTKSIHVINGAGQWLNGDAAASYLRMLAAGAPAGGISSMGAGRTYAEQQRMYGLYKAGKGNLAAKPGTSLHEKGNALDVSRGTAAQLWMVHGGDPYNAKAGEKVRANAYGWFRTVNNQGSSNEPWHFSYDRAKDTKRAADLKARLSKLGYKDVKAFQKAHGLTADGIDGPQTWAALLGKPIPAPAPTPLLSVNARMATWNLGGFGKAAMGSAQIDKIVKSMQKANASIFALTEAPEWLRNHIRGACACPTKAHARYDGARWRVAIRPGSSQAILFDSAKWEYGGAQAQTFGPTSYHGGVWVTFRRRTFGHQLLAGVMHLPPNVVSTQAMQKLYTQRFVKAAESAATVWLGSDGIDDTTWAGPLTDARIAAKASPDRQAWTYRDAKGKTSIKDRIHTRNIAHRTYTVIDVGSASDHRIVLDQNTLTRKGDTR